MNTFIGKTAKAKLWLVVMTMMIGTSLLTGCSGCSGKKKSSGQNAVLPPVEPTPTPTADPTPEPAPGPVPSNEDVGEEFPTITVDSASNIDTSKAAALKHLVFQTTPNQEAGRYLSEFLIAVSSKEKSCVRLKVRPTAGISAEVDESVLQNGNEGTGACAGQKISGEELEEPAVSVPSDGDAEGAALRQALNLDFITPEKNISRSFNLAGQTAAVCSSRIFRMTSATNIEKPLASIFTKTGRLLHVGAKVRIWLDEEYANVCAGGSGLDAKNPFGYGVLVPRRTWPISYVGKLWTAHLESLGKEMDKIITDMTTQYGPISDIDQSNFIEIFVSPDVNRTQFIPYETNHPDEFRARHQFKPEDLAYYNSSTNPTSNEGEILYMFTPDQAGIYNGIQFPTPDSVASNYAKGFLSAQALNLIVANQKLFVQKKKAMEDAWLSESLAYLVSAYYAGNDYSFDNLANFFTSRPQNISLNLGADSDLVSQLYLPMANDEAIGMRTLFGWYLHSRLCGSSAVTPCDKIKNLIISEEYGIKNVEALLGEPFDKTMINFTLSVGIGMLKDPAKVLAFWDKDPAGLPAKPILMPNLGEIYKSAPPLTEESDRQADLLTTAKVDRTQAGPFPSKDALLFQPITADNDMEFKTAENSVTFILVTSLVETESDVTAFFGKGMNVTFIPIGDRDVNKRRIHVEKVSELAHRDLRAANLTQEVNLDQTNRYEKEYEGLDFSVTPERELWILGSTDNYQENIEGGPVNIADTDAYTIDIQPCSGKSGADLTACQALEHVTVVQISIRDFEKELAPMLIATTPEARIFRGSTVYGRLMDIDPTFTQENPDIDDYLCQSEYSWDITGAVNVCDNAGLKSYEATFNHNLTMLNPKAFAHNYTNFLMSSLAGFPYNTSNTITYKTAPKCDGYHCYLEQEHFRQHFIYDFKKELTPRYHQFWTTKTNIAIPHDYFFLTGDETANLALYKSLIDGPCPVPTDTFVSECLQTADLTEADCRSICTNGAAFENKIKSWIAREAKVGICRSGISCTDLNQLQSAGPNTTPWITNTSYIWYTLSTSGYWTYYQPVEPESKNGYCAGEAVDPFPNQYLCYIRDTPLPSITDIRHQFDVPVEDLRVSGCGLETFGTDFRVCLDNVSWWRETRSKEPYAYYPAREKLATDRTRQFYAPISTRAGEVLSKPERLQLLYFKTPGTGAKVNLMVGGRNFSQGKYLIRARLKEFEQPYYPSFP